MKAVVWTDTIQFIFTVGGVFTVMILGINAVGGFSEIWRIAGEGNRLEIFEYFIIIIIFIIIINYSYKLK